MTERQGVEIDYCPQCRGVWLDRGELDKVIERSEVSSNGSAAVRPAVDSQRYEQPRPASDPYRQDSHFEDRNYRHKNYKKEGFLGDLFDF